jgi:uncharacterized membrane protein YheB (UPF0754 family)
MKIFVLISLPIIGATIGWVTNVLAVKLLFRPHKPMTILGYKLQGLIPKRQKELSISIGKVVEDELISIEDLVEMIKSGDFLDKLSKSIFISIKARIFEKFPGFIPATLRKAISEVVSDNIRLEMSDIIRESMDSFAHLIKDQISLKAIVEEKINNFSLNRLEEIIFAVVRKELRHIEILGGFLGFFIGLIQAVVVYFAS